MPTLDDVYRKFGEASETAQLLETELGSLFLESGALEANLLDQPDPARASNLVESINRQTLGQLLTNLKRKTDPLVNLEALLLQALAERNRLSHSFFRQHNFRRNSDEGRAFMLEDLQAIDRVLLDAYKA